MSTPLGPPTGTYAPPMDGPAEPVVLVPPTADRKSFARVDMPSPPLTVEGKLAEVGDDWSTDMEARRLMARTLGCSSCGGHIARPHPGESWLCPVCHVTWVRAAPPGPVKPERLTNEVNPAHEQAAIFLADLIRKIEEQYALPTQPTPTPEAMTMPDLLARDEALRQAIDGATRAGDLERARALFLERLGVGREIGRRKAQAIAAAALTAQTDDRTPDGVTGGVETDRPVEPPANACKRVSKD